MPLVRVDHAGGVSVLTLDRPDARNALSIELCDAIVDALEEIDARLESRVIVLRGEGKVFCSGADFAAVSGPRGLEFLPAFERMLEAVARTRLPTIAAIHGAALGGGLQLATACDFRVADGDAKIGIPSSKIGILVNFENVQRLMLLVGHAAAREILITGRTYSGEDAERLGLLNRAVEPGSVAAAASELAAKIASVAPLSVQGSKRAIQAVVDHLAGARSTDPEKVAEIDRLVGGAYRSDDLQEGLAAMAERRPPRFTGR